MKTSSFNTEKLIDFSKKFFISITFLLLVELIIMSMLSILGIDNISFEKIDIKFPATSSEFVNILINNVANYLFLLLLIVGLVLFYYFSSIKKGRDKQDVMTDLKDIGMVAFEAYISSIAIHIIIIYNLKTSVIGDSLATLLTVFIFVSIFFLFYLAYNSKANYSLKHRLIFAMFIIVALIIRGLIDHNLYSTFLDYFVVFIGTYIAVFIAGFLIQFTYPKLGMLYMWIITPFIAILIGFFLALLYWLFIFIFHFIGTFNFHIEDSGALYYFLQLINYFYLSIFHVNNFADLFPVFLNILGISTIFSHLDNEFRKDLKDLNPVYIKNNTDILTIIGITTAVYYLINNFF